MFMVLHTKNSLQNDPIERGKALLHLQRSSPTSINSGFLTFHHFMAELNTKSSKVNAAKTVSSSFWSFDEYDDPILWIKVLKKSFDETLTWGYRFDDKLERSAVYYFKDEFSVAILVTDSTERKFMKCTIPRLSRFPSFMAPVRAQTSANADGNRKAFYLVPFTLQESIAVGTTTFTLLQERGSSTLIICRKINMTAKEGKWTLCY